MDLGERAATFKVLIRYRAGQFTDTWTNAWHPQRRTGYRHPQVQNGSPSRTQPNHQLPNIGIDELPVAW
jgi:hypothetical protein